MDKIQICLANNMKRLRKKMNFSQEKLAEEAGASANYIAMIEAGRYFPSLPMLRQIAGSLHVDSLDLFDRNGLEYKNLEALRKELLENMSNVINTAFDNIE
ncbi:MAG: helix-turn-helix transcriptional regulator [Treponema sp.]|jgi:transcriptional regulator with XRE-family HTH domain|nr:helix-turn-helix transcriptional regulator [Treponema sp.]HBB14973.1 hypothetical protein [Treponema sp.]